MLKEQEEVRPWRECWRDEEIFGHLDVLINAGWGDVPQPKITKALARGEGPPPERKYPEGSGPERILVHQGDRFGAWTVLETSDRDRVRCGCSCGRIQTVLRIRLLRGLTHHCSRWLHRSGHRQQAA